MTGTSALPQHLQQRLQAELKPGESIAWVGQPNPDRSMKSGFMLWFFFVPWTAVSVFMMWTRSGREFDYSSLFFVPFVLTGIGGLCLPLLLRRRAKSTIYAVTNQRALSIEGGKSIKVKSYLRVDIEALEKTMHKDGSGDLILRTEHYRDSDGDQQTRPDGFFAIDDVQQVERLIGQLAKTGQASYASVF